MLSLSEKLSVVFYAELVELPPQAQADEVIVRERIEGVLKRLVATVARYHGRVLDEDEHSMVATFDRPLEAVVVALAFQQTQHEYLELIDDGARPAVQIGVAVNEELGTDGLVAGPIVTEMQQLARLDEPGGVVITAAICDALSERSPIELGFLGEHKFESARSSIEVYRIGLKEGAELPPPPERVRKARPLQPLGTMRLLNRYLLLFIVMAAVFAYFSTADS